MNYRRAYTLIEIIIVLALLSLLLGISMPNIGFLTRTKEVQELKEFKRDLLYTRNKAIVDCKTYKINLDYINNGYSISSLNEKQLIKSYKFQYGIKLLRETDLDDFNFTSSGAPSKANTITILDSRNQRYELTVAPATGKITLYKVK